MLKTYLVDVPVKINVWIRPDCQKKQFEVIKQARPSILFIQSDGGRNEEEWAKIRQNRKMIDEGIDWDCKVYRIYEENNIGLYAMGRKVAELIWSIVDRCVFLEDDILPSVSYFSYCAELLEKYKNDQRIECICGMNHLGVCDDVESDYFFSRQGSIWGFATWKRCFLERNQYDYFNDTYVMKLLKTRTKKNPMAWRRLRAYANQDCFEGHVAGGEFWIEFHMYSQNRLQIIPKRNMINNIGFGEDSEHFDDLKIIPSSLRNIFNMKTYELDFPIKHAKYVIPDTNYENKRNRIMIYNQSLWIRFIVKIETIFLLLRYGKISKIKGKIKNSWKNLKGEYKHER